MAKQNQLGKLRKSGVIVWENIKDGVNQQKKVNKEPQ